MFACARESDGHVVLGAHDGHESWTVMVGRERGRTEQLLVSLHEKKHQELQQESPWGFLIVLARAGACDPVLFPALARRCKQTHEVFATYNSAGNDPDFVELLAGNRQYLGYHARASRLADSAVGRSPRFADAVLRLAMAPRVLEDLTAQSIFAMEPSDLSDRWSPDVRLRRIEQLLADDRVAVERRLAELHQLPETPDGLTAYRDDVAEWLSARGVESMSTEGHSRWVERVVVEVEQGDKGDRFRFQVELVAPSSRVASELDDMSRERLQLHDRPLPLEVVTPDVLRSRARDFARAHEQLGVHSLMVWLRRDLFDRQFDISPGTLPGDPNRPLLGLLACDRMHGRPTARFCCFAAPPSVVFATLKDSSRILFLTTLASIVDTAHNDDLRGVDPVFAIIDQPVLGFCEHTLRGGARLAWRVLSIEGDRDLSLFVFANSLIDDVLYLHFSTAVGRHHLVKWLRLLEDEGIDHLRDMAAQHEPALAALAEHIVGTFWRLDQFGGRP